MEKHRISQRIETCSKAHCPTKSVTSVINGDTTLSKDNLNSFTLLTSICDEIMWFILHFRYNPALLSQQKNGYISTSLPSSLKPFAHIDSDPSVMLITHECHFAFNGGPLENHKLKSFLKLLSVFASILRSSVLDLRSFDQAFVHYLTALVIFSRHHGPFAVYRFHVAQKRLKISFNGWKNPYSLQSDAIL